MVLCMGRLLHGPLYGQAAAWSSVWAGCCMVLCMGRLLHGPLYGAGCCMVLCMGRLLHGPLYGQAAAWSILMVTKCRATEGVGFAILNLEMT